MCIELNRDGKNRGKYASLCRANQNEGLRGSEQDFQLRQRFMVPSLLYSSAKRMFVLIPPVVEERIADGVHTDTKALCKDISQGTMEA